MVTITKVGIITFKKYTERVLLDSSFNVGELYAIMDNDKDFIKFEIEGINFECRGSVTVLKHEEIIGTTYNAFKLNPYSYKKKISYGLSFGGSVSSKKQALIIAEQQTSKQRKFILRCVN